tara:strand:+ start:460 stop:762 length:303 start_codon:yes stop_codon:yes gene_type:complete
MGRKKEFKVAKSFTITVKNIAWLEERCHETGDKASVIIERLINKERHRARAQKQKDTTFYCLGCERKQQIIVRGFASPKFICSKCGWDLTKDINKYREMR